MRNYLVKTKKKLGTQSGKGTKATVTLWVLANQNKYEL